MFDISNQLINEISSEEKIYRIFPINRAIDLLNSAEITLVRPALWDDPFENILLNATVTFPDGTCASLESLRDSWYGQCWTSKTESDAMWRIYSKEKTGVRLSTTVRKLFDEVCPITDKWSRIEFFVGKVLYYKEDQIIEFFRNTTLNNLASGADNRNAAQTLLLKRDAFEHEQEIRLLYCTRETRSDNVVRFKINPSEFVDEIMLDPRLTDSEVACLTDRLQSAGYEKTITRSQLYQVPSLVIRAE